MKKWYKKYYEKNKDKAAVGLIQFYRRINSGKYNTLEEALTTKRKTRLKNENTIEDKKNNTSKINLKKLKKYYDENRNKATIWFLQFQIRINSGKYNTLEEALTTPKKTTGKIKKEKRNNTSNKKDKKILLIIESINNTIINKQKQKRKKILKCLGLGVWILGSIYLLKRKK